MSATAALLDCDQLALVLHITVIFSITHHLKPLQSISMLTISGIMNHECKQILLALQQ